MNDDVHSGDHWRTLYGDILGGEGNAGSADELRRWLEEHPAHVAEVREAGRPGGHRIPLGKPPERGYGPLVRLYAMSRILDLLILNYQERPPGDPEADPDEAYPPVGAYPAFCEALGADRIDRRAFHPFFHEIAEVRQADDPDEPPAVVGERWPGYMMGSMLLMRAGVVVTSGARHLVAGVADRSTLYWTYWRRSRPTDDLSHGWGHNSQWATDFRRDYLADGLLHYNVDAALDPGGHGGGDDELDPASVIELVRYRCSTVVDHGADQHPYDDHHVEPAPAE
ncbi:hypothetical protein [Planomonospora venezuelensis]|uniref:Uncharacterized protein n=1 Tax=Planomonospora venezuelensis TaxID=1999 RepID=A0A841D1V8_PLAVE|nr:hypothetical protein [Planomonospora venezuelensis]MBB5964241.1 hypothetical protein [Planomonospora venezuelensis]GIN02557.1 hypothetical protein Pve01_42150 [Planomonospora venezuelensis]